MTKLLAASAMLVLMSLPSAAQPNFTGQWQCPGHGALTLIQNGAAVTGTFNGPPDGTWGPNGRRGGKADGTIVGSTMTVALTNNDNTQGGWTVVLSGDGSSFSGAWLWMGQNGTFTCQRT